MIVNLTEHIIRIVDHENKIVFEPSGQIARVWRTFEEVPNQDGIPIFREVYGEFTELPEQKENTFYITSQMVARAASQRGRRDVVFPSGLIRSQIGVVVACRRLELP